MTRITLILIAVLVGLGVSFFADDFFSGMLGGGPLFAILIAIAGALAAAILLALVKSLINLKPFHAILGSIVGALLILFLAGLIIPKSCDTSPQAEINCSTAKVKPKTIKVCPTGTITWNLKGPDGTEVKIDTFKKRRYLFWYKKAQPLNKPEFEGTVPVPIVGQAVDMPGYFKYTITCTPPGGNPIIVDPMIDIPKK